MKTGLVDSWAGNPGDIGAAYPFVGSEITFFLICFVLWILYTLWQMKFELTNYLEEVQGLSRDDVLKPTIEKNRETL